MSKALEELTAQVAANTAVEASAVALIHGIADELTAAHEDPAKVIELAARLKLSAAALAEAVAANTVPAATAAPAAPAPAAPAPAAPVEPPAV